MEHLTSLVVRRGMDAMASDRPEPGGDGNSDGTIQISTWALLTILSTMLFFSIIGFMIEYTYGRVVPTLVMIESSPATHDFEPLPTEDDAAADAAALDPEQRVSPKAITSSFRQTTRLLRNIGGFRALFRGFWIFWVKIFLIQIVASPMALLIPKAAANTIATIALAQISLTWTHVVISEPSPKAWWRRIPSFKAFKKVIGPTALQAVCVQAAVYIPFFIAYVSGLLDMSNNIPEHATKFTIGVLGLLFLSFILLITLVIPANVILTRVQASLLPDSDETIVPFDRSFGGKHVPEIIGGNGIGMLDAWTTFDWAARVRLVKTYLKMFALALVLYAAMAVTLLVEVHVATGGDYKKMFPGQNKNN